MTVRTSLHRLACLTVVFFVTYMVHEAGHLGAAKSLNMLVTDFDIGMGPRVASLQIGETAFSLRAFPFGGEVTVFVDGIDDKLYDDVKILSMLLDSENVKRLERENPLFLFHLRNCHRSFSRQPGIDQFLVIFAGPLANLLFAVPVTFVACCLPPSKRRDDPSLLKYEEPEPDDVMIDTLLAPFCIFSRKRSADMQWLGPVSLAIEIFRFAGSGLRNFLVALIFLNLTMGIFNLLPLPILDGGRIALVLFSSWIHQLSYLEQLQIHARAAPITLVILLALLGVDLRRVRRSP